MGGIMDYKARFYSPYLNRFLQPDTLIPDLSASQGWNRYTYVSNRPINFNDPTGHRACGDGEIIDCDGRLNSPTSTTPGCGGNLPSCGGYGSGNGDSLVSIVPSGPACEVLSCDQDLPPSVCPLGETCYLPSPTPPCASGGMYNCPPIPPMVTYPSNVTLHLLDSNVVSWDVIYDYSYFPPKPIGYTKVVYKGTGNIQVDPYPLIGMAADEVLSEMAKELFVEYVKKPFMSLGISLTCIPECQVAYTLYQIGDNVNKINESITYNAHLVTETVYYPHPSPINIEFPLYLKIK